MSRRSEALAENRARQEAIVQDLADRRLKRLVSFWTDNPDRTDAIDQILAASRKPCPPVVERRNDDGTRYFVFQSPIDGTTYGTRQASVADLLARHDAYEDRKAAEFRTVLETETAERFASQVAFWIKEGQTS